MSEREASDSVRPETAADALGEIRRAGALVRRHTINSGLIPLMWGLLLLILLPLFDVLPTPAAGTALSAGAIAGSIATVAIAVRSGAVRPSRAAVREYVLLFAAWGAYYVVVIMTWALWLAPRLRHSALVVGPVAAAPLLVAGARMWWRGRA